MSRAFAVSLDGEKKRVIPGMKIRHLLTEDEVNKVHRRELVVVDGHGHQRGLDGALSEGMQLFRKKTP